MLGSKYVIPEYSKPCQVWIPVKKEIFVSQKCDICGKIPSMGRNVSHSHKKTPKTWGANIQKVRVVMSSGAAKQINACTKCLKANKIARA